MDIWVKKEPARYCRTHDSLEARSHGGEQLGRCQEWYSRSAMRLDVDATIPNENPDCGPWISVLLVAV